MSNLIKIINNILLGNIVLILGFVVLILAGSYRLGYFSKEVYIILDVLSGV
ncbi:hypothetical protein V5E38_09615 [Rossellomorea sp. GAMAL-10_SWC]